MVEDLINNYIIELLSSKHENKRLAAVWIIRELTINVPTLLNIHLTKVLHDLWPTIHDTKLSVRLGSINALRECLNLIIRRPQAYRQQFEKIYNRSINTLNGDNEIHGSLLTFGELLSGGEYMSDKFAAICQITLSFKKNKNKYIRNAVIELLPKLAKYSPSLFVSYGHLKESVEYLMNILSSNNNNSNKDILFNKNLCYNSLGKLSLFVERKIRPYLNDIVKLIKYGLNTTKYLNISLKCLSDLVCAVGSDLSSSLKPLIGPMFVGGLSNELIITLKNICNNINILQQPIHEQLAAEIWNILSSLSSSKDEPLFDLINEMNNKTYKFGRRDKDKDYGINNYRGITSSNDIKEEKKDNDTMTRRIRSMTNNLRSAHRDSFVSLRLRRGSRLNETHSKSSRSHKVITDEQHAADHKLIHLALSSLSSFNLDDVFLLPFIREIASVYLNYDESFVRKQASLTCSKLLSRLLLSSQKKGIKNNNNDTRQRSNYFVDVMHVEWEYRMKSKVVSDVLQRLLSVGITDPDQLIRAELLQSFGIEFDHYLSKNDSLNLMIIIAVQI